MTVLCAESMVGLMLGNLDKHASSYSMKSLQCTPFILHAAKIQTHSNYALEFRGQDDWPEENLSYVRYLINGQ